MKLSLKPLALVVLVSASCWSSKVLGEFDNVYTNPMYHDVPGNIYNPRSTDPFEKFGPEQDAKRRPTENPFGSNCWVLVCSGRNCYFRAPAEWEIYHGKKNGAECRET